ncbi:kynureninase [Solitalea longa]|uniref:Kynureninase n=1 Tax=Solitalea longa TaxID=2079460 RepID=A0A2S4ZY90_9SPHI|nr:kynureninase [Solitalea longa]POY34853.1 kynureninase [Solitalea longa]
MNFENTLSFAQDLDRQDKLSLFRNEFLIPQHNGKDIIYLCGNSLGLQPKSTKKQIEILLNQWENHAVEGWFTKGVEWMHFHESMQHSLAKICGAKPSEVTPMNNLTVNLHLMMVSFYKPTAKRHKILMEARAFPSDQYAIDSQVQFHGYQPEEAVIELGPNEGENLLRTEDILATIDKHKDELALILMGGINYLSGQLFDMETITKHAKQYGITVGFDLAHAMGNAPLKLHDWGVDFAMWCSYKYMNSSPGGISGIFVHENNYANKELQRFAGWWGYEKETRFLMTRKFKPEQGAEGWQVSTSQMLLLAAHKASLDIFDRAGFENLRAKSELLTAYLEFIIDGVNQKAGKLLYEIVTPRDKKQRGCQLSIIAHHPEPKKVFEKLTENGVIGDWREPNVMRFAPVPLYNTFEDVYRFGEILALNC